MSEAGEIAELSETIISAGLRVADEVEVYLAEGSSVSAELKRDIIGEAGASDAWALGIRTIKDGKIGISSTSNPRNWRLCLDAAVASTILATPQEWNGLPGPADLKRKMDVFDSEIEIDISVVCDLISGMLEGAKEETVDVAGGSAGLSTGRVTLANSSGLLYTREKTGVGISLETISGTSTGYEFDNSCFIKDIDPEEVGREAAFLAAHSVGGRDVRSSAYDVILSPLAVSQLIGAVLLPALNGRNVKAGRSFFADKLGEKCMDEKFSLYDDPFNGPGSTTWDAEGVPTKRLDFVKNGVLECFSYDLKTASRYGEESTGSAVRGGAGGSPSVGVHNLYIDGPRSDIADERALYAHSLIGAHTANAITGDFSVELSNASWMECSSYGEPIRSAMLSGNVFEMFDNLGGMSHESRTIGSIILPSVRFNNLRIIGK
ncbi:MAG: metallopeptidase TldD-related protein [Euryarchaeota archaeon]|nr:metallopeptidase TldD-related protein [Euryarchaeota archaeon]